MSTINDVARIANVSITTVSRVVNDNYPVNKETKARVMKAVEELAYKPNMMARSLITKKTSVIGIIVPGLTNLFFPTIVEAIEKSLRKASYTIFLGNSYGNSSEEIKLIEDMTQRAVDGIIIIDPQFNNADNGVYKRFKKSVPLVVISGFPSDSVSSSVTYDEKAGSSEAFSYLISLGHRKIAFIRGENSYSYDIKEKIYKKIIKDNNLIYSNIITITSSNSIEAVENTEYVIKWQLKDKERPTAIFACNDLMAVGCLNACRKLSIKVPEEMSIIGCDNTLLSEISNPKLTSVNLHMKEAGEIAASRIISIINGDDQIENQTVILTDLVIRDSCSSIL
jgi:LacI family transcriptional regulator